MQLLLVADQFEELYTLCRNEKERQDFLDQMLATLVTSTPSSVFNSQPLALSIVLTLRADFFGQALSYRPFSDALQRAQLNLADEPGGIRGGD